jgi:hypothetical protein
MTDTEQSGYENMPATDDDGAAIRTVAYNPGFIPWAEGKLRWALDAQSEDVQNANALSVEWRRVFQVRHSIYLIPDKP